MPIDVPLYLCFYVCNISFLLMNLRFPFATCFKQVWLDVPWYSFVLFFPCLLNLLISGFIFHKVLGKFQVLFYLQTFFLCFWGTPGIHALGSLKLFPQLTVLQFFCFSLCFILDRYCWYAFKFISLVFSAFYSIQCIFHLIHRSFFISKSVCLFLYLLLLCFVNFLNIWNTFIMFQCCSWL